MKNLYEINFLSLTKSKKQNFEKHVETIIKNYGYKMYPVQ
jgi:hypothetical protein